MKPTSPFNAWLARIAAALVSAGAIFGSSLHLYAMSVAGQQVAPWAQPLSLDAVALVAGAVRRCRRDDRLALTSLVVTVVLSTALQVSDSWAHTGDATDALLAALPPLGGWLVFELFLRATEREPTVIASRPRQRRAAPAPPTEQPPTIGINLNGHAKPANGVKRRTSAGGRTGSDEELVAAAIQLADARKVDLDAGWKPLAEALRADGHPIGTTRAQRVLELARARMKESTGAPS